MRKFYSVLLIFICIGSFSGVMPLSADETISLQPGEVSTLAFPQLRQCLYHRLHGGFPVTIATVYLPADYSADKDFPLVLWLSGNTGGAGDHANRARGRIGNEGFIVISMPLFRRDVESLKADGSNYNENIRLKYEEDNDVMWATYQVMLERIFSLIPNIDRKNCFMGGFSNGGNTTAFLLNRPEAEITEYFSRFFFIEGGRGLENISILNDKPVIYFFGTEHDVLTVRKLKDIHQQAKDAGAKTTLVMMEGVGHDFPETCFPKLREWLQASIE